MPESRKRKDAKHHNAQQRSDAPQKLAPSPRWWAPTMVALMLIGLLLVVITYLSGAHYPIPGIGNWNLAVGFGTMVAGMFMSMGWR